MRRLLALVLVATLTGCASLPMAGPIRIGPDLVPATDSESFYYSPSSPFAGASQADIISGFLAAGTGPQNDYAVAREYLSEAIRSSWNPNQEVLIQRSSPLVSLSDDDTAEITVEVAAVVDADGKYLTAELGTRRVLDFSFVSESGEWRLSKAPDTTVLIRPVFDVVFSAYSVYFLDRQKRFLVPELRWFPATAATGTRLVNALLRGASDWLRPAVLSAIPTGTRLSIDAVTVEDGVALVDLTARALVATRSDRSLMKAQLESTLSQLPNVIQVAISIERSTQEITDSQLDSRELGTRPLAVLGEAGLELVGSLEPAFFQSGQKFFETADVAKIAVSSQTGWVAGASDTGVFRTRAERPGAEVEVVDSRAAIESVEFDRQGYLWTTSRGVGASVNTTFSSGESSFVKAPWLASESIRAFALSPEGSKAAVLVRGAEQTRLFVSAVVRDQTGRPIELAEPIEISADQTTSASISWISQITIATVNVSNGLVSAVLTTIGGTSRSIPVPAGTKQVLAAGTNFQLYLLTEAGELFSYRGSTWTPLRPAVRAFAIVN